MPRDTVRANVNVTGTGTITENNINLQSKSQPCTIEFNLVGAGNSNYKFPADSPYGINIITSGSEFSNYTRVSDTKVTVDDANDDGTQYTYDITLVDAEGGEVSSDPLIINR